MAKKKKKISINAVDKYLKQMKYRSTFKKPEKLKLPMPHVVIPRIKSKRLQESFSFSNFDNSKIIPLSIKVPVVKLSSASSLLKTNPVYSHSRLNKFSPEEKLEPYMNECPKELQKKRRNTAASVPEKNVHNLTKIRSQNFSGKNQRKKSNFSKKSEENVAIKSGNVKKNGVKLSSKLRTSHIKKTVEVNTTRKLVSPRVQKLKKGESSTEQRAFASRVSKKCIPIAIKNKIKSKNSVKVIIQDNGKKNNDTAFPELPENIQNKRIITRPKKISKSRDEVLLEVEVPNSPLPTLNAPCLCNPAGFAIDESLESHRESIIPAKYRQYMEELKSLTPEAISKFIVDNKQYYIDFRRTELTRKMSSKKKRRRLDEMKNLYKCNPFNSTQQVAMYLTLREVFDIPVGSFMECRYFFTMLIPEICCQLFARMFKIKVPFAPRLVKKLYPQPVCPV